MRNGIFVTATGTDVGKTYLSALLVKALRERGVDAGYFKPALSGAERRGGVLVPGDAEHVCRVSGLPDAPSDCTAYLFEHAVSPHLAARMEGRRIEEAVLLEACRRVSARHAFIVAEGCGGICCPLRDGNDPLLLPEVIKLLGYDLLVVAPSGLGAINSAVLTVAYARQEGIPVRGILLNRFEPGNLLHEDNRVQIEALTGVPVLACVLVDAQSLPGAVCDVLLEDRDGHF